MQPIELRESDLAHTLLMASETLGLVMDQGKSLESALQTTSANLVTAQARGALSDLAHYALRWRGRGVVLTRLLTGKDNLKPSQLEDLLTLALALIWNPDQAKYPVHTVVDQAVKACAAHPDLVRAKGLVNACLRNFLRDRDRWVNQACNNELAVWNFPAWWIQKVRKQHPKAWQHLLRQGNEQPPMVLRVNARVGTAQTYADKLAAQGVGADVMGTHTVRLHKPCSVDALPGFWLGHVSVQDTAAQLAAPLLKPQAGQRVLDACAAPGGKTGHLLELADLHVVALDESEPRLRRVQSNFERLKPTLGPACTLELKAAPAQQVNAWWDGVPFDHILADLPCSGSGVVRRHPDIRWLRRPQDVANLSQLQQKILESLWSTLKPGGTLLLVTCSIFAEEGPELAKWFATRFPQAQALPAPGAVMPTPPQGELGYAASPDGFFYALFAKPGAH